MESDTVCANIKLLGFVERTELLAIMKNAQFIVQSRHSVRAGGTG